MKLSGKFYSGKVIDMVIEATGLDIKKRTRRREYVEARALCYALLREHFNMSYWTIGHTFGITHASVLHADNNFPYMMKFNPNLKEQYFDLNKEIQNMKARLSPREKREYSLMDQVVTLKEENRALKLKISEMKRKSK